MKNPNNFTIEYMDHEIRIKKIQTDLWIVAIDNDVEVLDGDYQTKVKALAAAVGYIDELNEMIKEGF